MIDAHVHLWALGAHDCIWPTPAEGVLHRDFDLPDLHAMLDAAGIEHALLVQSQESARDTAWLLDMAERDARIAGVVGWADIRDPHAVEDAARHAALRGLRPMVQHREDAWYDDPALGGGLRLMAERGLVLDALVRPRHLAALDRLAIRHPALAIVIDHAAKPEGEAGLPAWREAIAPLADRPGVSVKLSGLLTELPRHAVQPTVETLTALFGPDRLIWGSDWPVVTTATTYEAWLDLARSLVPARHHAAVFGDNARRTYGIRETANA